MFSFNAYCFCPEIIIKRINDPEFFLSLIIPTTINSPHHVILDSNEQLWLEYLKSAKEEPEAFHNIDMWGKYLSTKRGKRLLVDNIPKTIRVDANFVSDLTIKATATCKKYIVTSENNSYSPYVASLKTHGIDILSEFNLSVSDNLSITFKEYTPITFYDDMVIALSKIAATRVGKLENEHNDYLRDLLSMRGYDVYDQARLGSSSTGLSVGNLDLIIKSDGTWVTTIEPLRLSSVDKSNILLHYNKLIDNYNPLRLINTHLVIYYIGNPNNFNQFYDRYCSQVNSLTSNDFNSEVIINCLEQKDSPYEGIKSFIQQGAINGSSFCCFHTCINFS